MDFARTPAMATAPPQTWAGREGFPTGQVPVPYCRALARPSSYLPETREHTPRPLAFAHHHQKATTHQPSSVHLCTASPALLVSPRRPFMCVEYINKCPACGKAYLIYVHFCWDFYPPLLACPTGTTTVLEDMHDGGCPSPVCPNSRTGGCIVI